MSCAVTLEALRVLEAIHHLGSFSAAAQLRQYPSIAVADSSKILPARSSGVFESRQVPRVNTMRSKIQAPCLGMGVGYLPTYRITDELRSGRLVLRSCELSRPNQRAYLA